MNKPRKHAEVIKAWADGAEIECRFPTDTYPEWTDTGDPGWYDNWEYRVKPQPKKYKVDVWLVFRKDGTFLTALTTPPDASLRASSDYHVIYNTIKGELPDV